MSRLCGAGVLPFSVTDSGEVLFVLGKECYVPHWRGSSRWSGFEGGTQDHESVVENAVREFCEESIGVLNTSAETLARELSLREYAMCISIHTASRRTPPPHSSLHVTYVKRFEYNPQIALLFEERRKELTTLQQTSEALDNLQHRLPSARYPFLREGDVLTNRDRGFVIHEVADASFAHGVFRVVLVLHSTTGGLVVRKTIVMDVSPSTYAGAQSYRDWFTCRARAEQMLLATRVPPESIVVSRLANGHVKHIKVLPEFLEKACVRYWTLDELQSAVSSREHSSVIFRPYFAIVLRTVLERFVGTAVE